MRKVNGHSTYEFGEFVLNVDKLMLYRDEVEISLPPKVVKTLAVLVENRGEILSKDELMEKVWSGSVVEESNLSQYLYLLRKTVGNKPDGSPYIETLRRRGYRFTADVQIRSDVGETSREVPLPSPSLIGREREIGEVIALLSRNDGGSIVTISGVGGVGKTTLARAVADRWNDDHFVVFVELASINRPDLMVSAIASALGIKESPGTPLLDSLKASLSTRPYFLLLDNFEQIASAGPSLSELVDPVSSNLKLLVTSRVPLHVPAETVFTLQPLPVPVGTSLPVDELAGCESVRLFTERSRMVQPQFELTSGNLADVAGICRKLNGLPLAIELAAARMNFMSPAVVLKRLEKLDVLSSGPSDAPKRQQTIRETIAWSYGLLNDSEKLVFARLGIFSGGCDLEAAESVCKELLDRSNLSVLDAVSSLVEHNLLVAKTAPNGDPRIQMLEVVREFAVETLVENFELESARLAHAEHFLAVGEEAEPMLVAARSATWLERLETEHDNLRQALAWSRQHDPSTGQRLAGAIWRFWWLHGHIREACDQLDRFLEIPSSDSAAKAKMLTGATFLNRLAGRSELSRKYAEDGVKLSEASGDLRNGALAFNQLGFLSLDTGDLEGSERMFDRGLKKAQSLGDIQILALLNNGLGELSRMKEDYDRAGEFYGKALEYNRSAGDRVRQTTCLINLGATALMREDREGAGSFYRQGLEISSEMEDMNGTLYCLEGLAGSYWAARDPDRSALLFGAAHIGRQENNLLLEPADKIPYDDSVARVRDALGESAFHEGFSDGTKMSLKAASALALEVIAIPKSDTREQLPHLVHGTRIAVQRHGNVLRLVDWQEAEQAAESSGIAANLHSAPNSRWSPVSIMLAGIVLAGIAGISVAYFGRGSVPVVASADQQPENKVTLLTNGSFVYGASISPDGNYFAYSEIDTEGSRLYVQQTGQSSRVERVSMSDQRISGATFTPDGRSIYFLGSPKDAGEATLFRIPTIGGTTPTKLLSGATISTISFSPDGKEMAFTRTNANDDTAIVIADKDGRTQRDLVNRRGLATISSSAAWSPDGTRIVFSEQSRTNSSVSSRLKIVDVASGNVSPLSEESWETVNRIEWIPDGSGIIIVATRSVDREIPVYHHAVYHISYPAGTSRRITSDGNRHDGSSLGVSKDGSILVVPSTRTCHIWSMKAGGDVGSAHQLTRGSADGRAGLVFLSDGRIAYTARTAESLTIWVAKSDGSEAHQLETGFNMNEELRGDPAGRFLVFSSPQQSTHHLFRIDPEGRNLKQLTFGDTSEIDSTISPDGKTIVTHSEDMSTNPPKTVLKKIPSDGGAPEILAIENCRSPLFSPDGSMLSCIRGGSDAVILTAADGREMESFKLPYGADPNFGAAWKPDSTGLIVTTHEKNVISNLTVIPRDRSKPYNLTNFTSGTIYRFTFSHDGSHLLFARGYPTQDAILIRNAF